MHEMEKSWEEEAPLCPGPFLNSKVREPSGPHAGQLSDMWQLPEIASLTQAPRKHPSL